MKQVARRNARPKPKQLGRPKDARQFGDISMWCATTIVALAGIAGLLYAKQNKIGEESLFTFFILILVVMFQFGPRSR